MNKKHIWWVILIILLIIIAIIFGIYLMNNDKNNQKQNPDVNIEDSMSDPVPEPNTDNSSDEQQTEKTGPKEPETIATFDTPLKKPTAARKHNIEIACESINNHILQPGDVFSFNETVGPTSEKQGYEKSDVMDSEGNITQNYGGGVCQVSTTLYNAVMQLGLEIIERHEHSGNVAYIEDGKDATVSYGVKDFQFKNTLDYPITVTTYIEGETVKANIIK